MAEQDELLGEQGPETTPDSVPDSAPENEQKGEQPQVPYVIRQGKFAGKSPEQLADAYEALERKMGEQGGELGYYRQMFQNAQLGRQEPERVQAREPEAVAPEKFDWDNPEQTVRAVARKEAQDAARQAAGEAYQASQRDSAATIANYAFTQAAQQSPGLFKGREHAIFNGVMNGLQNGALSPKAVTNPETWRMMAWQMYGLEKGYNVDGHVNPVSPTSTGTPGGTRGANLSGPEFALDENLRAGIRSWGQNESDVLKDIRERNRGGKR